MTCKAPLLLSIVLLIGDSLSPGKDIACVPNAPDGYRSGVGCVVTIDRSTPASPATITVPGKTKVTIHVINAHANEAITITPTTTEVAPVDVAGTFLKAALSVLQTIVVATPTHVPGGAAVVQIAVMKVVLGDLADANVQLSCLEKYMTLGKEPVETADTPSSSAGKSFCTQTP